jgi:GT2 family glycosyltransferase
MTSATPPRSFSQRIATRWLIVLVHLDAFRLFPARYLTAAKWWILRKRVRARGQFAPLLSKSPRAYDLLTKREAFAKTSPQKAGCLPIIALVQPGDGTADLNSTLQSLAEAGIEPLLLSGTGSGSLKDALPALDQSRSEWFLTVRGGDRVGCKAGETYAAAIAGSKAGCSVIYADDDKLDPQDRRIDPHFKPDWNSELHRHHDFLTRSCIVRAGAADLDAAARHNAWDRALVAQAAQQGSVMHIPVVLHHLRSRPSVPTVVEHLQTVGRLPPVSVIIPTRNRADLLRTCIGGLRTTRYPNIEIIVANNGSDDPEALAYLAQLAGEGVHVIDQPGPFNYSTINNNAVAAARGELLCLLNNDIEVLSPDWLAIMASQAMRPEVGAVGAQLLYPDGRIQHAGVVIGVGNAAGHAHRFLHPEAEGYFRRHALPQYVTAVTAACLVVRKDRFLAVGGLDATNFPVAFNDVDLCLKLNEKGWQSFYEPRAVLVHHESVSRGHDTDPVGAARFAGELAALQRIWRTNEIVDPFHHPMLSRASEQFALDLTSIALPLS